MNRRLFPVAVMLQHALLLGCTLWLAIGCGPQGTETPPPATDAPKAAASEAQPSGDAGAVVARYGGRELTTATVLAEMERLPAPSRAYLQSPDRKKQFVENLILNDLLFEEGRQAGHDKDAEIQRQVDELKKRLVVQRVMREYQKAPEVSDDDAKKYYDDNPTLYSTTQIRASHILVKDEGQAKELLAQIKTNPDSFGDLAKEKSTDKTSAQRNGDLGLFGQGRMVPEFERAAFGLKVGELSDLVKTQYGFHIIKVTERKDGERRAFDQVKEQIRATLRNKALQERTESHYVKLKADAKLQIDDAALEKITPPTGAGPTPVRSGH